MKNPSASAPLSSLTRRHFLKVAGAASVAPCGAWGAVRTSASNRITMAVIGWGMQGPTNCKNLMAFDDCQMIAACDLDPTPRQAAVDAVNAHYGNKDCKGYQDYRELFARDDLDAVIIAVPDHWHALLATAAAERKKDIFGEKPLARTISDQQAIVKAVEQNNVIWQTGSWQRSLPNFHKAAEIVRNGLIGNVTRVEVGLPGGHHDFAGTEPALMQKLAAVDPNIASPAQLLPGTAAWNAAVTEPPAGFSFDTWIGPAQPEPYIQACVHKNWRWNYNIGAGQLMDWIGHHGDIAHWGLGFDLTGPSEVEGHGNFPNPKAAWNTATSYRVECTYKKEVTGYANDVALTISGGYPDIQSGTKWYGPHGWVWCDRGKFDASNPDWVRPDSLPEELRKVKLYESANHWRNFLDCIKSRKPTITPVQTAHHSTIPGHLGLISMMLGRKIRWDVAQERIVDDSGASAMLSRPYRAPWQLA